MPATEKLAWESIQPKIIEQVEPRPPALRPINSFPGENSACPTYALQAKAIDDVRKCDAYRIVTPDECIDIAKHYGRVILHPLIGGLSPKFAWQELRLFEEKVLSRLHS